MEMETLHEEPEAQTQQVLAPHNPDNSGCQIGRDPQPQQMNKVSQQQQQQQPQQELQQQHEQVEQQLEQQQLLSTTVSPAEIIHLAKPNGNITQDVTEELIFESIENASGNGSDYGSSEEKDPVYEEVETEEEIYADCSIKTHGGGGGIGHPRHSLGPAAGAPPSTGVPSTGATIPLAPPSSATSGSPATRSPVDSSITSDLSRDMLASPNSSQNSHYDHSNSALSDPECDSDLLLKCSSPEEEDDLLGEMQCKQDIDGIDEVQQARAAGQDRPAALPEQQLADSVAVDEPGGPDKNGADPQQKRSDTLKTLRPPINVDPKKLMPQALKPISGEETIIAREIRMQKEREEEIQKERLEARRKAEEKLGHLSSSTGNLLDDRPAFKAAKSPSCRPLATSTPKGVRINSDSGASKIEDEIRQLKQREEELRRMRESLQMKVQKDRELQMQQKDLLDDSVANKKLPLAKTSACSTPTGAISTPKQSGRRQIKVRPLDDGDEVPETTVYLNETPIEREIRLAKERDDTLRREKGLLSGKGRRDSVDSSSILSERSTTSSASSSCSDVPPATAKTNPIRHAVASKIQEEIEEQTRKEIELKKEGVIRTISVERSDSKVAKIGTDSAEASHSPRQRTSSSGSSSSGASSLGGTAFRRPAFGPVTRGISMQKFIASQGRDLVPMGPLEPRWVDAGRPRLGTGSVNLERKSVSMTRRGLISAETKIHQELKLFKERESELRRMRKLGGSQPNLSTLSVLGDISMDTEDAADNEEVDDESSKDESQDSAKGAPLYPTLRQRVLSNPNLLDCVDEPTKVPEPFGPSTRRKSAMVAEWENRIRQVQELK